MLKYLVMPLVFASTSAVAVAVSEVAVAKPVRYLSILPTCKVYTHTHTHTHTASACLPAGRARSSRTITTNNARRYCIAYYSSRHATLHATTSYLRWLDSRVVSVLDSGAEGSGFESQPRRCRVIALGKLFTPIVPLFTKHQNW